MVWNKTNLPAFFYLIICLQKLKWINAFWEANTASINVSDTAEPAHQGERQDSEEHEQEQDEEGDVDSE